MLERTHIETQAAPKAVGPYSQAIKANGLVYVSGQLPITLKGELIQGTIQEKTKAILTYIEAILKASGSSIEKVLRVEIFLTDLSRDFVGMNEEYQRVFSYKSPPARQTIGVAALPKGVSIEISCIAVC